MSTQTEIVELDPRQDGIDHVNIWSQGRTELGRRLSFFSREPFVHPVFGEFDSLEGAWYWLKTGCQHNGLRRLSGYAAKKVGKMLPIIHRDSFRADILACLRCKIEQNEDLEELLRESTLPFAHYYCYGNPDAGLGKVKIIPLPQHQWWVDEIDNLRRSLQQATQGDSDESSSEPVVEPPRDA